MIVVDIFKIGCQMFNNFTQNEISGIKEKKIWEKLLL